MRERLPLFPLGTVLFPGVALPLHVFEERYRTLVRELLELPEQERRFGVIAIREGREVGDDGVRALHAVGTVAQVDEVVAHPDGRFDVSTHGAQRFRLHALSEPDPYLSGIVELLPEDDGDDGEAQVLARAVGVSFTSYLQALAAARGDEVEIGELPRDPGVLSCLVGAAVDVDLADRQAVLEEPGVTARLAAELRLLRREATLLRTLSAVPAPQLVRTPLSPN